MVVGNNINILLDEHGGDIMKRKFNIYGRIDVEHLPEELKEAYEHDLKKCTDLNIDANLINVSDILKAYYILADYFTDPSTNIDGEKMLVGVGSYDLLSSAVGRQSVEFGGERKYTDKIDICSTLFYGLVKNHSFYDGNKRTGLLILLYQLQLYGYFPKPNFNDFEKLVVAIADNSLAKRYPYIWKKYKKTDDPEIHTISQVVRKLVVRKNNSYHLSITTKEFCNILERSDVEWELTGNKIRLKRTVKKGIRKEKYTYTINFYGWTRPVRVKMVRDTCNALHLSDEYPDFNSLSTGEGNIYKTICEFEIPLRRLKDE